MATKSLKIPFDSNHNPITPTVVLANRDGNKLGVISKAYSFHVTDAMAEIPTLSFKVTKRDNEEILPIWDEITNLKLIWCVEWDYWFEIQVELEDANETIKSIDCTALAQAELSQTNLYNTQINTEDDIAREAYDLPTTIYNAQRPDASLLNRMLDKNPNYSIKHVDDTLKKIQRTFEFNGSSLKDCFNEVEQEIGALFTYGNNSAETLDPTWGKVPERTISLYDMESTCTECGYRGEFEDECPKCGSTEITEGYGEDTTIFVSKDNLTDDVTFSTDVDSVKNCFRLVGGDDLMTATIRNCNPNGSNYVWFIPEMMKHDMPESLVKKLEEYDKKYIEYQNTYNIPIDEKLITEYNKLVEKYSSYQNEELRELPTPLVGYTSLSHAFYDIIDFSLYLEHSLMPIPEMSETSAEKQAARLTSGALSPCAVTKMSNISKETAELNVLAMARVIIRPTYKVETTGTSFDSANHTWKGKFIVTNYSDEEDTAESAEATVTINENYEKYVQQKLEKALSDADKNEEFGIVALFKMDLEKFKDELKKYGLVPLQTFYRCCQVCLDVLTEYGAGNPETWMEDQFDCNLYEKFYADYLNKLSAIEAEIKLRESETNVIQQLQDALTEERAKIQEQLDLEKFLGEDLWKLFCSYRREDEYENSNYISDGLSNSDLFRRADEFIESAQRDLFKSATMQHHITATLKNLLVIKEFEKLLDYFEVGNWMRIECDGVVYKLRMIKYEIDFDDLEYIDVEFSDVVNTIDGRSDIWSILSRADSVASSYDSYRKRSEKGEDASNQMDNWFEYGLDTTLTRIVKNADNQDILWDEHGLLFREKDYVTGEFRPEQMKIINKTIAITSDAWKTLKTAIGNFYYVNPKTRTLENGYGINGEVVIGKLILGKGLGIYNDSGSMTFDEDGFKITNNHNTFTVNPNSEKLLTLSNSTTDIFWVDVNGMLHIQGDGAGLDIHANSSITGLNTKFEVNEHGIQAEVERASKAEGDLRASLSITDGKITAEVERAQKQETTLGDKITQTETTLSSQIEMTEKSITSKVTEETNRATKAEADEKARAQGAEKNLGDTITSTKSELYSEIEQTAKEIRSTVSSLETTVNGEITTINSAISEIKQTASEIKLSVTTETNRATKAEQDEADRAKKAEGNEVDRAKKAEQSLQSSIDLLPGKLQLSVSGGLGNSNASITLSVKGTETSTSANMDLGSVRSKFAADESAIEIKAGTITFDAKTLVVKGTNFSLDANGNVSVSGAITAKSGTIGNCTIDSNGNLQVPAARITGKLTAGQIDADNLQVKAANITGSLTADHIDVTNLQISEANITGTLSASKISVTSLSALSANLGTITGGTISGVTGSFSGSVTANSGKIGGWNITTDQINDGINYTGDKNNNSSGMCSSSTGLAFWAGNGRFSVRQSDGQLTAENANITGVINATSLTVTNQVVFEGGHYISSEKQAQAMYFSAQANNDPGNYKMFFGTVPISGGGRGWTFCPSGNAQLFLGQTGHVWSTIFSNSGTIQTSDRNKKNNIVSISSKYESFFNKLRPVSYRFNSGDRVHTGFISQDIEEALEASGLTAMDWAGFCRDEKLDSTSDDEYNYALRYDEVIPLNTHMIQKTMSRVDANTETIQKTMARVDDNTNTIQEATTTIQKLTNRIAELEAEISALKAGAKTASA